MSNESFGQWQVSPAKQGLMGGGGGGLKLQKKGYQNGFILGICFLTASVTTHGDDTPATVMSVEVATKCVVAGYSQPINGGGKQFESVILAHLNSL